MAPLLVVSVYAGPAPPAHTPVADGVAEDCVVAAAWLVVAAAELVPAAALVVAAALEVPAAGCVDAAA